jgi:hypothetical protein
MLWVMERARRYSCAFRGASQEGGCGLLGYLDVGSRWADNPLQSAGLLDKEEAVKAVEAHYGH